MPNPFAYACTGCMRMDYDTSHSPCHDCGASTTPLYSSKQIREAWEGFAKDLETNATKLRSMADEFDHYATSRAYDGIAEDARRRAGEW